MSTVPHFIVNPAAAAGRAARWWRYAWPVLRRRYPGASFGLADARHSLADRLAEAGDAGHREVVGVGGDGTHHLLVNAAVAQGRCGDLTYAPLPLGSGNDWCRTLAVPRNILRWMDTYDRNHTVAHRIGRLTYGDGRVRHFINMAGMAYDAEVVRRSAAAGYRHRLLYPLLTAAYLRGYTPPELELEYDGHRITGRFHTINLGLGRFCGGGMQLLPQADPTGDTLALTFAVELPTTRILANSWRFYTSSIGKVEGVTTTRATSVKVGGTTGLEADGEYLGGGPVRAELTPERLRVQCGEQPVSSR
ncbi:diacylglycerol/lipid kinase family protein [Lewinella sp. IMCC34183]|uniref:diacylglycerol/lipid kinase family protein n=1 Tax=Lewinella sp. IMCC34183 TaxID=2248762 RepID=UPI000E24175B|nr:diacylglycerol kinase family protein [Lewinella sp. IMCC34183]